MSRREFIALFGVTAAAWPIAAWAEQPGPASIGNRLFVSIPHHLSKREALRRLKSGLATLQRQYSYLFTIQEESWTGYHLQFRASVLGQAADGSIDITSRYVYLSVFLPWLLATLAHAAEPLIVKEGTLMLERK
jgi:Putative polyhydroxyalkanoic acid system protein (PHA_gran_rgn)